MRSFASTLSLSRGVKSDTGGSVDSAPSVPPHGFRLAKSRSNTLLAKAPKSLVETGIASHSRPLLTPGSSSSSDGSASLRTPDDEGVMAFPKPEDRKRWSSWFGWRKSSDKLSASGPSDRLSASGQAQNDIPYLPPRSTPDHSPRDAVLELERTARAPRRSVSDTDDEDLASGSSDSHPETTTANSPRAPLSHATIGQAQANLRTLLRNRLNFSPSPPPLVDTRSSPHFPRSSTDYASSQYMPNLEATLHIRRMMLRLEQCNLTHAEIRSIAILGTRPRPKVAARNGLEKKTDDDMMSYASMRVGRCSRGLHVDGQVVPKKVMGVDRGLAVYDLEFSEWLEALAGLSLDDQAFEAAIFPPQPNPKGLSLKQVPWKRSPSRESPRKASFQSSPSPLRLEHGSIAKPVLSPVPSPTSVVSSALTLPPIPVAPMARARETSRKSLATDVTVRQGAEREKRAREKRAREASARQKRAEEERQRAEEERRRAEEAKRAHEEKRRMTYEEEVAAARRRRESARAGMESVTTIRESHRTEQGLSYTRPAYDTTSTLPSASRLRTYDYASSVKSIENTSMNGSTRPSSVVVNITGDKRRSLVMPSAYIPSQSSSDDHCPPIPRHSTLPDNMRLQQQYSRPVSVASSSSKRMSLPRTQSAPVQIPTVFYPMMPAIPPCPSNATSLEHASDPRDSSNKHQSVMQVPPGSSRSLHASPPSLSKARHSQYHNGDDAGRLSSSLLKDTSGTTSRSASHPPRATSSSQPRPRDDRSRQSYHSSSKNLMILESMVLSTVLTSLSVVYQAYAKIKSNRGRCEQLVGRCQLIVDRLHSTLLSNNDTAVMGRIKDLERTFRLTAETITKVGQQNYIVSVLRTDENAALIEDSQHALTELVTILTLEQIIDVSTWQREYEVAYRRDTRTLIASSTNVAQGNATILSEIAKYGTSIDQLKQKIESLEQSLNENDPFEDSPTTLSASSPSSTRANRPNGLRISPLSRVSSMSPQSAIEPGYRDCLPRSPLVQTPIAQLRHVQPQATDNAEPSISYPELPITPPPPYRAWEEDLAIADAEREDGRSANSRASTELVYGFDSPILRLSSDLDLNKPLPDDALAKVREALKRKDITNFPAMKTIGSFGRINTRAIVEMWTLPKILKTYDKAIPLSDFVSLERNHLQLIRSRSKNVKNEINDSTFPPEYNHVLLLCPREVRPSVIITKNRQTTPQQSVKAYVLDTVEALTLVSVKDSSKKIWLLIPYYPQMHVWEAKQYVQRHFGDVFITGCRLSTKSSEMNDALTLSETGINPYEHGLCMKVSTLV
ncbi:hypothetical protein EW145_g2572 [Phellinidium pouzarii]|uniref:Uncharacterized protein n=1 Tax=Phellinidium pouzarii TaxID=167371 RepID=A0A4S4LCA5_9AGAM|nr:hypothetical protein EW145_g2572 [Phellinidium pouzarii]